MKPKGIRFIVVSIALAASRYARAAESPIDFFEKRIRPLLVEKCYSCHGAGAGRTVRADLRVDTRQGLLQGGDTGPAVVPGDPERSLLIKAVRQLEDDVELPHRGEHRLTAGEVADLVSWIRLGAPDPRESTPEDRPRTRASRLHPSEARAFWSFQPAQDPPVPQVRDQAWPLDSLDRFILARLEAAGLEPVGEADRRTLLRRASFDMIGLPPSPEEVQAFLADESPEAFSRVVDRLLASPHYGERWGRHWLDLVRYADTAGDNSDYPVPQLYRYRNYVIESFNRDKPYDRFIREQIAGDLLPSGSEEERRELVVATGYLALARRFGSAAENYPQHLTIEDTIDNLGRAVLGLSLGCARCHDHKYDPVSTEDYYALYGIFESTRYPFPGIELDKVPRDLVPLIPAAEADALMKPYRERLAVHDGEVKRLEAERAAAEKAVREEEAKGGQGDRALVDEGRKRMGELREAIKEARKKREDFAKGFPPIESAYAVSEGKGGNSRVHLRGDPRSPGPEVARRFLAVLGGQELPPGAPGSGRLELAGWLTSPGNPLTARVMVNRIWQHHFGKGLVPTPSDFGSRGEAPSHPELLDHLARSFLESGWSVKALHRRILLSRTYRLASTEARPGNERVDPENKLLWKFRRRRLEAEAIRDAMLAASGGLERGMPGPHAFPPQSTWGFTQHKPFLADYPTDRRSVYLMTQRIRKLPFFATFDGPDPNSSTAERPLSTTPLQALYLLNDPFVHQQARRFAERLLRERSREKAEDLDRLELAHLLALGRPPLPEEKREAEAFLAAVRKRFGTAGRPVDDQAVEAWESYARALFRTSEFVTVD